MSRPGLRSLRWLMTLQTTPAGLFRPVGTESFGDKRKPPQAFDQQPLEATATISACLAAWRADGDAEWKADAARAFAWFLGSNDLSLPLVDLETGSCRDGLHPDRPNENRGGESVVSYLLGLAEIRQLARIERGSHEARRRFGPCAPELLQIPLERAEGALSQATFLNRQALYLRPDPARVVVRPFKPATEPRDLNPTDKTRANHIVDRVLALDPETAASQLADVLENFQGRHRNLLETFEARADEMEDAFAPHAAFTKMQRQLVGAYFLHEYSFEAAALFNPSIVAHPDQSGAPEGGRRFILSLRAVGEGHISSLTFRSGSIAADGSVTRRSDGAACLDSESAKPDSGSGRRRCRGDLQAGRGHQRAGDLSRHRIPVERHRGCALRGIRRWRANDLLRDLHRLQRQGDPVRADRDHRFPVLPHVAAAGSRRAEQGHGPVSRARSTASTP